MNQMIRILAVMLVAFLFALPGCGGGTSSSNTGRATLTIIWPNRNRLIPLASNSIQVIFSRAGQALDSKTIPRPASGNQTQTTFTNLKTGTLTLVATAFPNADASGVSQATGTTPVTIVSGQTASVSLTMNSTIDHLDLNNTSPTVTVGNTFQLIATAKDLAGNVVLTSPGKMQWSSSDASVASVDSSGLVTGAKVGTATITILEAESGKSAMLSMTVLSTNVKFNPANGHYYEVVQVSPITWLQAKAAAEARTYAGLRGHLVTQTSAEETDFLVANLDLSDHYLGAYQDTSAPDYAEPGGGWRWVTGEPWGYTNWIKLTNEPNDIDPGRENYTHYKQYVEPGAWNDVANDNPIDGGHGYVVEYE
jgi:hypothetical protein